MSHAGEDPCGALRLPPRLTANCRRSAALRDSLLRAGAPPPEPPWVAARLAQCGPCPANAEGVCREQLARTPARPCLIAVGVRRPEAHCPLGHWLAEPAAR